jgi:hypothetical protein
MPIIKHNNDSIELEMKAAAQSLQILHASESTSKGKSFAYW